MAKAPWVVILLAAILFLHLALAISDEWTF